MEKGEKEQEKSWVLLAGILLKDRKPWKQTETQYI